MLWVIPGHFQKLLIKSNSVGVHIGKRPMGKVKISFHSINFHPKYKFTEGQNVNYELNPWNVRSMDV
jgi:hypothetical protein